MTLVGLAMALVHLLWPSLAVDAITVTLLAIAVVPWLAPLFKSLELPGGVKVEFQELQRVHGASVDPDTATWAIETGARMLRQLDERVAGA